MSTLTINYLPLNNENKYIITRISKNNIISSINTFDLQNDLERFKLFVKEMKISTVINNTNLII